MESEYRPLAADDDRFDRFVRYAFRPEEGPHLPDPEDRPAAVGHRRGVFAGDELRTVALWHDFTVQRRGTTHRLGGVSAVATPPEFRRRGHAATMLRGMLDEFRDEGVPLSGLWPFQRSFYRRYGWATCHTYVEYALPPAQLREAAGERRGRFARAEPDDWDRLDAVRRATLAEYDLAVRRTEEWWRERVFRGWGTDPYVALWTDDDGEPGACVVYRVTDGDGEGRRLRAWDLGYRDETAFRQLLAFLGDHDSRVESVEVLVPERVGLLDRVPDPSAVTCEVRAGAMVRLVEPAALGALAYPDVSASLVLRVVEPLGDDATVRLAVDGGAATCEPTDASPDLVVEVGDLSQVAVGYRRASGLQARDGWADGTDRPADDVVETLDALFPPARVFLSDGF